MQEILEARRGKRTLRQQTIVDAARRIIIFKGAGSLTVREIAAELNITDGALYRHFKSKNKIISLLIEDIETTLLDTIEKAINLGQTPVLKLENIFFAHLSYAEQRRGVTFILITEAMNLHDKALRKQMLGVVDKYLKIIEGIVAEGIMKGCFHKGVAGRAASVVFWGMIQSTITHWGLSGYEYALKKNSLIKMFNVFKRGIMHY